MNSEGSSDSYLSFENVPDQILNLKEKVREKIQSTKAKQNC